LAAIHHLFSQLDPASRRVQYLFGILSGITASKAPIRTNRRKSCRQRVSKSKA
jgi:hypothetical protein